MTEREFLTKFLDYIYHVENKSAWYLAIGNFLEEHHLWTTEYPTEPGYYWIRNYQIKYGDHPAGPTIPGPEIVSVEDGLDYITWTGDEVGIYRRHLVSAEWCGPIQPPAEQDKPTLELTQLFHDSLTNRGKQVLANQTVDDLGRQDGEGK